MSFASIPWLPVLIGTVLSFVIGFLWYGPIFGKRWQQEVGLTDAEIQSGNMLKTFGGAFLLTLVMAIVLSTLNVRNTLEGLHNALLLGIGLVAAGLGINYLFSRRSFMHWFIDAIYLVLVLSVIGLLLGFFSEL